MGGSAHTKRTTKQKGMNVVAKFSFKKPLAVLIASGTAVGTLSMGFSAAQAAAPAPVTSITVPNPAPTTLDPGNWGGQILEDMGSLFEGLYGYNQQNQIVPKLATGYKISNNGRTWTFTLRKNAKWSNGDPVTAQDFVFSYFHQLDPANSGAQIWDSVLNDVANSWAYHYGAATKSQVGISAPNNYTLQITTSTPHDILGLMAVAGSMPMDPNNFKPGVSNPLSSANIITDGPYMVKSFVPNGTLVMVKNPNYVGAPGEYNVGNIQTINVIPAPSVPLEDFISGKLNVALIGQTSDYKYILSHPALKKEMHSEITNQLFYLSYDDAAAPSPLDNLKVREAIMMAIDRSPIVNNVLSGMGTATTVFGSKSWPASKYEKGLPYNVQQAQKLLAQAGYPGGKGFPTLQLYCEVQSVQPQGVPVAEAIQQELKQNLGINFKITPLASTQYGSVAWNGITQGIEPGLVVNSGLANWIEPAQLDMQASQAILYPGTYGYSPAFRAHVASWSESSYAPTDVKLFGDPNNAKLGTSASDMVPLKAAALKSIQWLDNFYAHQPEPYRSELTAGSLPLMQQWLQLYNAWANAKTPTDKHNAFVNAWKFVGTYSTTAGQATVGVYDKVWWYSHQSKQDANWQMLKTEMADNTSMSAAAKIAGKLVTSIMQQGYAMPLFLQDAIYLEDSNLTGAQPNVWSWGNFYQWQYMKSK